MLIALLVLAVLIVAFVAFVSSRPNEFRVERSATIAAPTAVVFEEVNDFRNWAHWSPWAKIDPQMNLTISEPSSGKGATYAWSGNKKAGVGRMEILESRPSEFVRISLQFIRPFPATNTGEFSFTPEGDLTRVTWTMFGMNNFMLKAFGLMMSMDKMVGGDFERGLAAMKSVSEAKATPSGIA